MSIATVFDILFSLQGIFGDKGKSSKQATLMTIMKTKVCVSLET